MPNKYEFDSVRWCRTMAKAHWRRNEHDISSTFRTVAEEIDRLRAENDALRDESRVYRAQCDMRDEWRDKIEAELAALKDEIMQRQDTEASLTKWVHDLGEELDALKDAARVALIDWRCCIVTGQSDAYDALAALVGEGRNGRE